MHSDFEKAAKEHGGKHAHFIKKVHDAMAGKATEQERQHAAMDQFGANLAEMKANGATVDEVFDSVQHVIQNKEAIKKAIKSGV